MRKPVWVQLGLFMLRTREQAVSYLVAASVGAVLVFVGTIAVMTMVVGTPILNALGMAALVGGMLAVAALWYGLAIRWMDLHDQW